MTSGIAPPATVTRAQSRQDAMRLRRGIVALSPSRSGFGLQRLVVAVGSTRVFSSSTEAERGIGTLQRLRHPGSRPAARARTILIALVALVALAIRAHVKR
ncbi:MAG TPA: hypothetical protein VF520_13105 [Thermoleophilaceae bacterium]